MANRTATLYIRITTKDGKKPYCKPVYLTKGRLKPLYAMVDGKPEHHPEGVYYIRFGTDSGKQPFEPVGNDPYVALDKLAEKERSLRQRERSVERASLSQLQTSSVSKRRRRASSSIWSSPGRRAFVPLMP